jgi:cytochrome c-type biogenesis protein CcmF
VGQSKSVAGVDIKFLGVSDVPGPNYNAKLGKFAVIKDGVELRTLAPERRFYASNRSMPMTEAAIDRGFGRDLYVSLGDDLGGGSWTVRVHYKPLVNWIWLGCVIMALGGLLGALDPRYRRARQTTSVKADNAVGAE